MENLIDIIVMLGIIAFFAYGSYLALNDLYKSYCASNWQETEGLVLDDFGNVASLKRSFPKQITYKYRIGEQ